MIVRTRQRVARQRHELVHGVRRCPKPTGALVDVRQVVPRLVQVIRIFRLRAERDRVKQVTLRALELAEFGVGPATGHVRDYLQGRLAGAVGNHDRPIKVDESGGWLAPLDLSPPALSEGLPL